MVFAVVSRDGNVMLRFVFPHGFILDSKSYIKGLEELMLTGFRGYQLEDVTFGNRTLHHTTQAEEPSFALKKLFAIKFPRTSVHLTH